MHERALLQRLMAGPVAGDTLAAEAGLTRAAIWKRIDALRAAGIEIDARRGRGYALRQRLELLEADAIRAQLPSTVQAQLSSLEVAWSLDSTNSELLRRETPAQGTAVLLAERQSSGRGRRGRPWASPLAAHLYLSLARRFDGGLARLGGLSLVAGVAAVEALQAVGAVGVGLKWPNDLVVAGDDGLRKLGGILVEGGGEHAGPVRAVIGIGLNLRMPTAAAAGIDQPWCDLAACVQPLPSRNALAAALLARLLPALQQFDRDGLEPFLPRYAALDALAGRAVEVHVGDRTHAGRSLGIASDGALRLDGGSEQHFHAGEVSVRAMNDGDCLFDLGNSRLKYAGLREDGAVGDVQAIAHDASDWTAALPSGRVAYLASVAPGAVTVDLIDALAARFRRITLARTRPAFAGVRIAYARPERLGVDRFLALLAAHARGGAWLVVGVGTALTLDLIDAGGRHVGGRIAPSPILMREMLQARAAQLPAVGGDYVEFADDTADALASGCEGAALALVERSLQQARRRLDETPGLLLHGGGADALRARFPDAQLASALVLEGLALWARVERPGAG